MAEDEGLKYFAGQWAAQATQLLLGKFKLETMRRFIAAVERIERESRDFQFVSKRRQFSAQVDAFMRRVSCSTAAEVAEDAHCLPTEILWFAVERTQTLALLIELSGGAAPKDERDLFEGWLVVRWQEFQIQIENELRRQGFQFHGDSPRPTEDS